MNRALVLLAIFTLLQSGAAGCLRVEPGIVVELTASALPSGAARRVWLEDGTELSVEAGALTVTEIRLHECTGSAVRLDEAARILLGPARAFAQHEHGASPYVLRGPFRVSLVDEPTILGVLTPPPGRFCAAHLTVGPDPSDLDPTTISFRARMPDGTLVRGWSAGSSFAHVELAEALSLDRPGTTVVRASFFEERSFARLPHVLGEEELGTQLLRGLIGQSALTVVPPEAEPYGE